MRPALPGSRCPAILLLCLPLALGGAGCAERTDLPVSRTSRALSAICTVEVTKNGVSLGVKDVEKDYVPNVVNCESGDLATEALKVQAVASRTYVYYKLLNGGKAMTSGTDVQVYDCARKGLLAQKHFDAVNATAGQILLYTGKPIWPCFVAGADPTNPPCTPKGGCCTDNVGKSGAAITQSSCGYIDPANYKNRGCLCQWGSDCYAKQGKSYVEILKAAFGDDIEIATVTGSCIHLPEAGLPHLDSATARKDHAAAAAGDSGAPSTPETPTSVDASGGGAAGATSSRPGVDSGCSVGAQAANAGGLAPLLVLALILRRRPPSALRASPRRTAAT
jgi:hypothetical protein